MQYPFGLGLNPFDPNFLYFARLNPYHRLSIFGQQMAQRMYYRAHLMATPHMASYDEDIIQKVNSVQSDETTDSANLDQQPTKSEINEKPTLSFPPLVSKSKKICKKEADSKVIVEKNKKRRTWSKQEDEQILKHVKELGLNWAEISKAMNGSRSRKQIRRRYLNILSPTLKNTEWTEEEDQLLLEMFKKLGKKWGEISRAFVGRSEFNVRNRFYKKYRNLLTENSPQSMDDSKIELVTINCKVEDQIIKLEHQN